MEALSVDKRAVSNRLDTMLGMPYEKTAQIVYFIANEIGLTARAVENMILDGSGIKTFLGKCVDIISEEARKSENDDPSYNEQRERMAEIALGIDVLLA